MQSDADDPIRELQEAVAHLTRQVDEMSAIVAAQRNELDRMRHQVTVLLEREADRAQSEGGSHIFADERPPHW